MRITTPNRNYFTIEELTALGFRQETDLGENYLIYEKKIAGYPNCALIALEKELGWYVDYCYPKNKGVSNRILTNLDRNLVELFVRDLGIGIEAEEWFEQLINR